MLGIVFIAFTNLFKVNAPVIVNQGIDFIETTINALDSKELAFPELPPAIELTNELNITNLESIEKPIEITDAKDYASKISMTLAIIFFVIFIIQGIFLFLTRVTIIIMSRRIEFDLKNEIYKHYQKLSLSFYKRNSTGDLMNRISEDVSKVRMYLGPAVMYTLNTLFLIVFVLYEMFQISVKLTCYSLLPLPLLSISIYYVSSIIHKKSEKVQKQQSDLSGFVQESISGVRVLKAYDRTSAFSNFFKKKSSSYKNLALDLVKVEALFLPLIVLLVGLSSEKFKGEIEFKNVSFTYEDTGIQALKDLNFTINPGQTLGITGKTGSGKSTLAALIARLYDTSSGNLLIDGKNIKEINLETYRDSLGIVPQDVFLFSDSIRNNIAFGTDNISDDEIVKEEQNQHYYWT